MRATYSVAICPAAPGRFSITKLCFSDSVSSAASSRPTMSVMPPGANATTMVTGLPGHVCACTWVDSMLLQARAVPIAATTRRRVKP
ncbi:hypothetical protein D9M69_575560 [compost metagenome]